MGRAQSHAAGREAATSSPAGAAVGLQLAVTLQPQAAPPISSRHAVRGRVFLRQLLRQPAKPVRSTSKRLAQRDDQGRDAAADVHVCLREAARGQGRHIQGILFDDRAVAASQAAGGPAIQVRR